MSEKDKSGLWEKMYDDIGHPSAVSIGESLSLIPRTVGVWLSKWEKWVVNGEESKRLTLEAIREKSSKIPEEKLTEPEPYVVIPAISQLSYCYDSEELRELYANLLVCSMNIDTKYHVHPAYVDIIKQLTPDEARWLMYLKGNINSVFPCIDIQRRLTDKEGYQYLLTNFTTVGIDKLVSKCDICAYLDNLERLKIIEIVSTAKINDEAVYEEIFKNPFYINTINSAYQHANSEITPKKKIFKLTSFGKNFVKCVIAEEGE